MHSPLSSEKIMKGLHFFILLFITSLYDASKFNMASKIPLKSIKSSDGDIIDCVDIYHQPAFDHPLLKNHTILMRPSSHPKKGLGESKIFKFETHSEEDTEPITQLWQLNGKCSEGTIPIRRTKKEDFLRKSSIKRYGEKKLKRISHLSSADTKSVNKSGHEHVIAYVQSKNFYGAKATINVWQPQVQSHDEHSLSGIWILSGSDSDLNSIQAGWMVSPGQYGDSSTRFFIYWTRDGYDSTGCFNLLCSGFVQINKKWALGAAIKPVSTYHGSQFEITVAMWKDQKQNVWWLQYGSDTIIGYWPASIFTNLATSATLIEWGGEVINSNLNGRHTTTQMGSGHFAQEKFGGASFFKNLLVVYKLNTLTFPTGIGKIAEKPTCYNIQLGSSKAWGDFFYYGGPGKNPNCP